MVQEIEQLSVEIVSPNGYIYSDECAMAVVPSTEGDMGFMANHETILTSLHQGKISIYNQNKNIIKQFEIAGGFAKMMGNKLLILVDS